MVEFSLRSLLSSRDLSPDAKLLVIALDRGGNRPTLPADLAASLGYKYDHTLSVIRELARAQIVALPRGAFSLREHTISIIDGSPWVGVTQRTGGAAPVATTPPEFDAGDLTPVVEAPPEVEEDPTVESKTKKAPKARKGETL
jgi:hypothetical protein